uniref:probable splicing factor YJU2B n=1 Tax=Doryrhamphus excisus TaxID=161450 RepID=UPI0025AE2AA6|nr:probable splicing factor YJU2B [Doryrhamphus excisus]XP_057922710.1 probable splicing factor YJU2B [Doryrhamphus excisus]XP_057922720.1 probable splicing factor YJU2B [Doryrhamphus excisus]
MGERKGTNKYYPPDFNPAKHGSLNGYHKTHALRERARKLSQGILIIRFEMPYNIWCDGCKNHIGMGVRYNAEKKKVGNYFTTPIYRFRMKCHLCINYIEMQTDPAACDYVIVSGASRKEERWDMAENEQILTTEREEKEKLETDAMFKLDHGGKDKEKLVKALPSLVELQDYQAGWKDDFQLNSALRRKFRTEKKVIAEKEEKDDAVRARTNLSIPLLPERDEDKKLAALLSYQTPNSYEDRQRCKRKEISSRSWFSPTPTTPGGSTGGLLHKLGLQGKEAAMAKALSPSQLIRKPCAALARRKSDPGEESQARQRQEASEMIRTNEEKFEEAPITQDCEKTQKHTSLGSLGSLVPNYSDSDSDHGH